MFLFKNEGFLKVYILKSAPLHKTVYCTVYCISTIGFSTFTLSGAGEIIELVCRKNGWSIETSLKNDYIK
jgi:hypothetical protein